MKKQESHHAKFDIQHIYGVWENPNVKDFDKPRDLTPTKNLFSPLTTHVTQIILCIFFFFSNVC